MFHIVTIPMQRSNALTYPHNTYKIIAREIFTNTNRLENIGMYDFLSCMEILHRYIKEGHIQFYILINTEKYGNVSCKLTHTEVVDWQTLYKTEKCFVIAFQPQHITIEVFDGIPEYGMDKPQG